MANDQWDDDTYRPRRYGNDSDYERNFWRDRESRGRGSPDEDRRSRYSSLPVFGLDYGNARRYPDRDERERYSTHRDRDEWSQGNYGNPWRGRSYGGSRSGRSYGDDWNRRNYGDEWSRRDYGSDWRNTGAGGGRDAGSDWARRSRGERGWWDRTKDEVRSWFGDEEAEHRREADHRGRGPRGYTRSDDRIREDVNDWLMEDRYVDATDIEVMVVAGEVTLTGTVEDRDMKWRAENLAADVLGVKDVNNRLRTRSRQGYGQASGTMPSESIGTTSSQASSAATGSGSTNDISNTPRH